MLEIYHDLSGAYGIYEEALNIIKKDKENAKKVFEKLVKLADGVEFYDSGGVYLIKVSEDNFMSVEELAEIVNALKKFEKPNRIDERFKVVAKVSRFVPYYIIYDEDYEDYLMVSNILEFISHEKVRRQVRISQRVKKIINKTIYLSNRKCVKFWRVLYGEKVIDSLRQKTKNGLLERAVSLGEGADSADNEVFYDIEDVLYYEEFTKEIGLMGIPYGLGFDGHAVGVLVGVNEAGEKVIILEEVVSYTEGYYVRRHRLSPVVVNTILCDKFKEALDVASGD